MVRIARLMTCIAMLVMVAGLALAQDKKDKDTKKDKVVDGSVCCAKCELKISGQTKCATVVKVKEGNKDVIYYFDADSNTKFPHKDYCQGTKDAKVTIAKTEEKDGKTFATVTKIEEKKKG